MPITARLVAKLVGVAGADRVLALDLHAGQIQGFFDVPVDEMSAMPLTAQYFVEKRLERPVVVSPDLGNTKRARNFAEIARRAAGDHREAARRQPGPDRGAQPDRLGRGCQVVIVDDEIDTAGSITQAARGLPAERRDRGLRLLRSTRCFSGPAIERLQASPIREVVVTQQHRRAGGEADRQAHRALGRAAAGGDDPADPHRRERFGDLPDAGVVGGDVGDSPHPKPSPPLTPTTAQRIPGPVRRERGLWRQCGGSTPSRSARRISSNGSMF